jgi:hypothetical protein
VSGLRLAGLLLGFTGGALLPRLLRDVVLDGRLKEKE